jgi:hypothetical protein
VIALGGSDKNQGRCAIGIEPQTTAKAALTKANYQYQE